ncbi:MAG: TIGR02391 family protein [Acidimicrobiales bacterium]
MSGGTANSSGHAGLRLKFNPSTIEHLGSNMYSRLPNAVAELVANAYDADAEEIRVRVVGTGSGQRIEVEDDGHGMSYEDLRDKYLRIGRNCRGGESIAYSESGRRTVSGKKGLGKLALFGVGKQIAVTTTREGEPESLTISMNWTELVRTEDGDYEPEFSRTAAKRTKGTTVVVSNLSRSTNVDAKDLAVSLARLFHYSDEELRLWVVDRDGTEIPVTRELRLDSLDAEFRWQVPEDLGEVGEELASYDIDGSIVAARKPLPTQMRGLTVYTSGRLANEPEFFGAPDSSYAYAYITGFISIDILDAIQPDVVATDRRSINWENSDAAPIHKLLQELVAEIGREHRQLRRDKRDEKIRDEVGVSPDEWADTLQGPEREPLRELLGVIDSDDSDFSEEDRATAVSSLLSIAPPHADMVWRHLHPSIQAAIESEFKEGRYYNALLEGCKQYVADLREAAGLPDEAEASLFGRAIGDGKRLQIAQRFLTGEKTISTESAKNLENGHRSLARAIWEAFRNPLSHEVHTTIASLGVISHHDCLDALSLMSHLRRRIDEAEFIASSAE